MYAHCIQSDRVSYLFAVVDVLVAPSMGFTRSGVCCEYIPGFGLFYVICKGLRLKMPIKQTAGGNFARLKISRVFYYVLIL